MCVCVCVCVCACVFQVFVLSLLNTLKFSPGTHMHAQCYRKRHSHTHTQKNTHTHTHTQAEASGEPWSADRERVFADQPGATSCIASRIQPGARLFWTLKQQQQTTITGHLSPLLLALGSSGLSAHGAEGGGGTHHMSTGVR